MTKGLLSLLVSALVLLAGWAVETAVDRYRPELGVGWRFLILFVLAIAAMALAVSVT
ncbi:hypothetical protein SAMN05216337_1017161 [Bradyrhizobium brasilense]|uniref:Uncharacterized protein n=1 Tax=Bradyrhizobium brasilense TaxID=1419277 RepID=A0A1G6Z2F0_9BRAD|nr:hypothetical protein [Bradyrhizobium brasilense]SDD95996.1 hypothetical protein SAMN05216337_1017161 [Bradyrhizobium brasilense]